MYFKKFKEEKIEKPLTENKTKSINYYLSSESDTEQMLEAIHSIMMYIDFEKIHNVMEFLDWGWRNEGVPTVESIKNELFDLLIRVVEEGAKEDKSSYSISCGGFLVEYHVYEPEDDEPDDFEHCVDISASFVLEESSSLF